MPYSLKRTFNSETKKYWLLLVVVAISTGVKVWLVCKDVVPFNSDEAIVALMARHIMQGKMPLFFYGQAYMGSFDAFLIALGFISLGEYVWVIRLVQILLYLVTLITTFYIGKKHLGGWIIGAIAMLLMAIPTVNVFLYTTVSLGGYGEALLIGNIILLIGFTIADYFILDQTIAPWYIWLAIGFFMGFGLWVFGLTLIYTLPVLLMIGYFLWKYLEEQKLTIPSINACDNKEFLFLQVLRLSLIVLSGAIIGSFPWLIYAIQNGFKSLILETSGSAIANAETVSFLSRLGQHFINFILFGVTVIIGARPPWSVEWILLPLIPIILFFWLGVVIYSWKSIKYGEEYYSKKLVIGSIGFVLILTFILTPFGADPSGRYFVPLVLPLSFFAAEFILWVNRKYGPWAWLFIFVVVFFNMFGILKSANNFPPGITTQFDPVTQINHRYDDEMLQFLISENEFFGYTNYWVSYPLAFLSDERVVFIPRLPYHLDMRYTIRDDRYKPYDEIVQNADHVAYITTFHEPLNELLRERFEINGVKWKEKIIGDYHIFYNLTKSLSPEELGVTDSYK